MLNIGNFPLLDAMHLRIDAGGLTPGWPEGRVLQDCSGKKSHQRLGVDVGTNSRLGAQCMRFGMEACGILGDLIRANSKTKRWSYRGLSIFQSRRIAWNMKWKASLHTGL